MASYIKKKSPSSLQLRNKRKSCLLRHPKNVVKKPHCLFSESTGIRKADNQFYMKKKTTWNLGKTWKLSSLDLTVVWAAPYPVLVVLLLPQLLAGLLQCLNLGRLLTLCSLQVGTYWPQLLLQGTRLCNTKIERVSVFSFNIELPTFPMLDGSTLTLCA